MPLQLHYTTLHHNCNSTTLQLQLQLQLHYTTLHSSCGWGDRPGDHCNHCNHSKKYNSNDLSVHQWIRSAIRDSQQPTSPIDFLFLKLSPPPCAVLLVIRINYSVVFSTNATAVKGKCANLPKSPMTVSENSPHSYSFIQFLHGHGLPSGVRKLRPSTFNAVSSGLGDAEEDAMEAVEAAAKAARRLAATRQPTACQPLCIILYRRVSHMQAITRHQKEMLFF